MYFGVFFTIAICYEMYSWYFVQMRKEFKEIESCSKYLWNTVSLELDTANKSVHIPKHVIKNMLSSAK